VARKRRPRNPSRSYSWSRGRTNGAEHPWRSRYPQTAQKPQRIRMGIQLRHRYRGGTYDTADHEKTSAKGAWPWKSGFKESLFRLTDRQSAWRAFRQDYCGRRSKQLTSLRRRRRYQLQPSKCASIFAEKESKGKEAKKKKKDPANNVNRDQRSRLWRRLLTIPNLRPGKKLE
jgi:hypothetical protein